MGTAQSDEGRRTARMIAQQLESLGAAGITHVPKPRPRTAQPLPETAPPQSLPATTPPAQATTINAPPPATHDSALTPHAPVGGTLFDAPAAGQPALSLDQRIAALNVLREEVAGCTKCRELAATRKQTVFGVGSPQARLVFLGEAPGADEDAQGEPFVGRAGQLLNKIIEACTLKREDVYILNVLKCRPPNNRTPAPDEVTNCRGYLNRQLEIIRPEFICCLGAVAARTLLETESSMAKLRGRFYLYQGIEVLCTYHPAYLLRNPPAKKEVWEDMKLLLGRMGIKL
jgi:DNA polymerase